MNKTLSSLLLVVSLFVLTGCLSDDAKEKSGRLEFVNASNYTVTVIPLTTEWDGFVLSPGEKVKLSDIRDPDFVYEPANKVQEGKASTERYIVFVNADPD